MTDTKSVIPQIIHGSKNMLWLLNAWGGGLSTGSKRGVKGSFLYGQNLDIHSEPDKLQINAKTTKDSSSAVSDLVLWMTSEGINNDIYALGDTGNFYKKTGGSWSNLTTFAGGNGQGLNYFNSLIYFASGNVLGHYNPATGAYSLTYQTLNSATWHPMKNFLDKIIIGNGQYLACVDGSGIWDNDLLTIDNDYNIKSLEVVGGGNWLLIGTERTDKTDCKMFIWDGFSTNYNDVITIQENAINSILNNEGVVLVNAGVKGNLYQYNGNALVGVKTIPDVERNLTLLSYPGAVANYQGNPLMGFGLGTSLTASRSVYSWTSAEKNYPKVLNSEYTISSGTLTGTGVQIGSLFSEGENELYIGWKDGSTYGIDLVDGSGVFASGEYQSRVYDADAPYLTKFFTDIKIHLGRVLRTGEKITLYYDADRSGSWTSVDTLDFAVDGAVIEKSFDVKIRATEIQLRLVFTITGSTSPAVDSIISKFTVEPKF